MTMTATVLQVTPQSLLVRNEENGEEIRVIFRGAGGFSAGERISITYNGQMTLSIPPQIAAMSIRRLAPVPPPAPPSEPSELRAVVLQRGDGFLLVRSLRNRQQFRVEYAHARHFCARQQVIIRYDTLRMSNPPTVNATDVIPVC